MCAVELTINEDGVSTKMRTSLWKGHLYLEGIEKTLAARKLTVVAVGGHSGIPVDQHGYTRRTFRPSEDITISVVRTPGE